MTIRGKWSVALLAVLVLSLTFNLFVAGFAFSRFQQFKHGHRPGIERMFGAYMTRFPPEIRHGLRAEMETRRPELLREMTALHEARANMLELMRADPLDNAALEAAMSDVGDRARRIREIGQGAVRQVIENTAPEVRAQIDPNRRHGPPWWRHRGWQ
ncbi:MAG: periplasmic heavy metal sensor [Fimbriimonadaceae bacterium]|nr:periplasmic heavy metal sensor [Alphaproteobacteria bacterium]